MELAERGYERVTQPLGALHAQVGRRPDAGLVERLARERVGELRRAAAVIERGLGPLGLEVVEDARELGDLGLGEVELVREKTQRTPDAEGASAALDVVLVRGGRALAVAVLMARRAVMVTLMTTEGPAAVTR